MSYIEEREALAAHLEIVNPLKPLYYRFTEEELKERAVLTKITYKMKGIENDKPN